MKKFIIYVYHHGHFDKVPLEAISKKEADALARFYYPDHKIRVHSVKE